MSNKLINGDCLEILPDIAANSIDLLMVDLPYGTTACRWDSVIPLDLLWEQYYRVCKKNAAMVFTAAQPFTSFLIASNYKDFKYSWVWEKSKASNYLNAKRQPLRSHEDIVVFYRKQCTYNPQMVAGNPYDKGVAVRDTEVYGAQTKAVHVVSDDGFRYPRSVQYFRTAESEGKHHPTQKPVALMEYLINTYSNPGDVVLDTCMGSGTTGVACKITGRQFIGIEKDPDYFQIARIRTDSTEN